MRRKVYIIILNVALILVGIVTVYPFVWMLSSSFKQNKEIIALEQHLLPRQRNARLKSPFRAAR